MRLFLSILGIAAALIMGVVSASMNYLFLASLGKTSLEGQVLGAASAAADLLKCLLPFFIAWGWRARRLVAAGSGALVFVFFSAFSLLSAIGFAADNRGNVVEMRESRAGVLERLEKDLSALEGRLASVPAGRPAAVLAEELRALQQNRRWSLTKECTEATEAESRAFCAGLFSLRAQLAASADRARLEGEAATLKERIAALRETGAGAERDPQVSLLARIFSAEQDKVRLALIIVVALLVELGSSLGLFLASSHSELFKRRAPLEPPLLPTAPPVSLPPPRQVGCIEDFVLEALEAAPESNLSAAQLYAGYDAWCTASDHSPMPEEAFTERFGALAKAVGLSIIEGRYGGLSLRQPVQKAA